MLEVKEVLVVSQTVPTSAPSPVTETQIDNAITTYLQQANTLRARFITGPPGLFPEENLRFNRFGQEPYLLISQFKLHELSPQIQRRLPIYLTKQFRVQVELDSKWFWALTRDVSISSSTMRNWYLFPAFETLFAAHLASFYTLISSAYMKLNRILSEALPQPSQDLLTHGSSNILMYICYPVLEGILKLVLRNYVDENGKVTAPFAVGTNNYTVNTRISDLSVYLHALEANAETLVSKPDLQTDLKDFRQLIETDFAGPIAALSSTGTASADGWDWIYSLRNVSLHGAIGWQLRSGLITNLICMLAWHVFELSEISAAATSISQRFAMPFGMLWNSYYPPN